MAYAARVAWSTGGDAKVDMQSGPNLPIGLGARFLRQVLNRSGLDSERNLIKMVNKTRNLAAGGSEKRPVSTWTVQRSIKAMRLARRVPATATYLLDWKKAKRLVWWCEQQGWSVEWASVNFSDESLFTVRDGVLGVGWPPP